MPLAAAKVMGQPDAARFHHLYVWHAVPGPGWQSLTDTHLMCPTPFWQHRRSCWTPWNDFFKIGVDVVAAAVALSLIQSEVLLHNL